MLHTNYNKYHEIKLINCRNVMYINWLMFISLNNICYIMTKQVQNFTLSNLIGTYGGVGVENKFISFINASFVCQGNMHFFSDT